MPHGDDKVSQEVVRADVTKMLSLANSALTVFPMQILQNPISSSGLLEKLLRLDLSHNSITQLPKEIVQMTNLQELWLQYNPIHEIPAGFSGLQKLEVLDIRSTLINNLPYEVATMKRLYDIDWRDSPLATTLWTAYHIPVNDLPPVMDILNNQYQRSCLEATLLESLSGVKYMQEADTPGMADRISDLVYTLSDMYSVLDEFTLFVRRADSLLPDKMMECTPDRLQLVKENFEKMQRETLRKRLSADVEIKLRAIYYDRAERSEIDEMLEGIYKSVKSLEDVQHLVKYAKAIMMPDPKEVTGTAVWQSMLQHQKELVEKREDCISTLSNSMVAQYPEQKPADVQLRAREVAAVFARTRFATEKELLRLTQVAAEVSKLFPPDWPSINPAEIRDAAAVMFAEK